MNHRQPMEQAKGTGVRMADVAAIAIIVAALLACWMVDQAGAHQVDGEAGDRPELFLCNELLPPMNFMKNGKPTGIVIDLAEAVAKHMHHPVEIRLMNWAEAQQFVLEGRADALLQIDPNPERLKIYDFSEPLLTSEFTIFTSAERLGVSSMRDLRGLKVGVEEKGLPDLLLQEDPRIIVEIIPDLIQGFRMLATGAVDAVVADRWVGSFVLAEYKIRGVKLIEEPVMRSHSAIAVKKGNTNLLQDINAGLADIRRDGTYDRIIKSWRSKEVVFKTREQLRQQAWLIAAISLALIAALVGVTTLVKEIRKRKKSEEKLSLLINNAPASLAMFDCRMCYLNFSHRWLTDYNLGDRDLRGLSHYEIFPEIPQYWKTIHRRALAGEVLKADNDRFERADGSVLWLNWEVRPWRDHAGNIGGIVIFTEDITVRKRAEEQIKASLAEKEVLLKEIHHRVKNNMQVISSLISLQADSLADEKLQGALGDVRDRVRTMALVHEKLYQTEDLARIDFAEYAPGLLNYLWSAHGAASRNVRLNMTLTPLILPVETVVNCGLILNELASNAIKHAFPDGSGGEVTVILEHDPTTGAVCLRVRDNGVGLPEDLDWRQSSSLGLRLVQMLAGQIRGTAQTVTGQDTGPGTEFQIRFDV